MKKLLSIFLLLTLSLTAYAQEQPRLEVSPDGHSLQWSNGDPFFYMADTAWELIHRLDREEVDTYLKLRKGVRFSLLQKPGKQHKQYYQPNVIRDSYKSYQA